MKLNRTYNAKRNIVYGIINKMVSLLLPFLIRTITIRALGADYLGLSSLFASILQVLNLTELGFSSAIVFSMYKPIADNDKGTLCALLKYYRKIYFVIGILILTGGLCVLPFLPYLISGDYPSNINIYLTFIVYLLNSAISYLLFAYKTSLLIAYQRADISSNIGTVARLITYSFQIVLLIIFRNYYIYLVLMLIEPIIYNVLTVYYTNKLYADIFCTGKLDIDLREEIKTKVKGLVINKFCMTSRNSFDSIFISAFLGLVETAKYNNYYYIMNAIVAILTVLTSAISAGVGNSIATEAIEKNYNDMNKFNFIYMIISGWCTVCMLCLYQPFISIFFGSNMLLPFPVVILFCTYFYILKMGDIRAVYSEACGLWWENRYRAIIESILNLVFNAILGYFFGIYGIIGGTIISLLIINFMWGSNIVFKYYFRQMTIKKYFIDHLKYASVTIFISGITFFISNLVNLENEVFDLLMKMVSCGILAIVLYVLIYMRTEQFSVAYKWIRTTVLKMD